MAIHTTLKTKSTGEPVYPEVTMQDMPHADQPEDSPNTVPTSAVVYPLLNKMDINEGVMAKPEGASIHTFTMTMTEEEFNRHSTIYIDFTDSGNGDSYSVPFDVRRAVRIERGEGNVYYDMVTIGGTEVWHLNLHWIDGEPQAGGFYVRSL